MKILYFDCPTGISGDMFLASLIDMGVDLAPIRQELEKLPVDRIDIETGSLVRHSIAGTTFCVKTTDAKHHRTFADIRAIIDGSSLSATVKSMSTEIFSLIAEAEGKVHGIRADEVHFHEVGALDSIIDIIGAALAIDSLGPVSVYCSPIPLGSGVAKTMHGVIPIPAPATIEILKGVPIASSAIPFELTTPTGAAIMRTLARGFGPMPPMTIEKTGYGAGKKDFKESANLLRVFMGEGSGEASGKGGEGAGRDNLVVLETNIDDMSPQIAGYLIERLLASGALEAYFTPVQMKKSRPGLLLTALCALERSEALTDLIFAESTSIGVREYPVSRHCLERSMEEVATRYGTIRVKLSVNKGVVVSVQPEYEDCRRAALESGEPLKLVMEAAKAGIRGKG